MRALLTWWAIGALLALGYVLGASGAIPHDVVLAGALGSWVAAGLWGVRRLRTRSASVPIALAVGLLSLTYGLQRGRQAHGAGRDLDAWAAMGRPTDVLWVRVVGAGRPGPRCRFRAQPRSGGPGLWISGPAEICPVSDGESVALLLGRANWVTAGPGQPEPHARARARGAELAVDAGVAWRGMPTRRPGWGRARAAYWRAVASIRVYAWSVSRGDDGRAFLAASILGLPEALRPEARRALRKAGVGHLIAVSGLHVGVVALLVHAAMLRIVTMLGARLLWSTIAAIGAVVAFVAFTGAAAPAVRAAIMVGVASVGAIVGRPVHGPTTLGAAVAAMLVVRPAWALDPGFHLSVVAMSVLVLRPHRGALGQTWAIGWAIVPVCLWHFGTTSPFAVITNLLVLPLFTLWVLPVGAFGWFGAWGWGPGALAPAALGADVLLRIATWVASWPAPSDWALAGIASTLALGRWVAPVRFRRLVPRVPVWVALAIVSVQLVRSGGVELREARWVALGTGRRPTVVRWVEDGRACLLDPRGPSAAWPSRLRALGVREVVGFGEVDSRRPDLAEVASRLDEAGMWRQDATIGCERPSSAEIREARRACTAAFVGTVAVASVRPAGRVRCYAENRWSPMVFSQAET